MTDKQKAISELKKIACELRRLIFRVELLELELAEDDSEEILKLQLYRILKLFCFKKDPNAHLLQSEIFGYIRTRLQLCPPLQDACKRMGWLDNKPSNIFWRGFWPWLAAQEGIERIVLSKNDIRFFGVRKANYKETPQKITDMAFDVLKKMNDDS